MPRKRIAPGHIIYNELVNGPRSIADLHREYIRAIQEDNISRPKKERARWMTYHSFVILIRCARLAGLVEPVSQTERPGENLLGIRNGKVVPATLVNYALTSAGESADNEVWDNITGYYRSTLEV